VRERRKNDESRVACPNGVRRARRRERRPRQETWSTGFWSRCGAESSRSPKRTG
jgi:hypothetical protein